MERLLLVSFSVLALNFMSAGVAIATEMVNGESIITKQTITTFDTRERVNVTPLEKTGVADDRLSPEMLNDADYSSGVEAKLQNLLSD